MLKKARLPKKAPMLKEARMQEAPISRKALCRS
jgi:hypothetical protein